MGLIITFFTIYAVNQETNKNIILVKTASGHSDFNDILDFGALFFISKNYGGSLA